MSLLIFSYRTHGLIAEKNRIDFRMMQLSKKLQDLQAYAAAIGDGAVTMNDLMTTPGTMAGRMSIFMQSSHQAAYASAMRNVGPMMAMNQGSMQNLPPAIQQQYQTWMLKSLYEQERQRFGEKEKKLLDREETKIRQEMAELETQKQMVTEELNNTKEALKTEAKEAAPKYA